MVRRMMVLPAIAVATLALAAPALSHLEHYATHITLHEGQPEHYKGQVSSGIAGCENHRQVTIYEKLAGPDDEGASQKTDGEGRYDFFVATGVQYVVKAPKKTIESFQHKHICEPGHSPTVDA